MVQRLLLLVTWEGDPCGYLSTGLYLYIYLYIYICIYVVYKEVSSFNFFDYKEEARKEGSSPSRRRVYASQSINPSLRTAKWGWVILHRCNVNFDPFKRKPRVTLSL